MASHTDRFCLHGAGVAALTLTGSGRHGAGVAVLTLTGEPVSVSAATPAPCQNLSV